MPTTPAGDFLFYRDLADSSGSSVGGGVARLDLSASNFDFSKVRPDGADLAVYDLTAGAVVPSWLRDFDPTGRKARMFFKAANTGHAHRIYYGNPAMTPFPNYLAVYRHGTGFDADWGDMATTVAGANAQCVALPPATGLPTATARGRRVWRRTKAPQIRGDVNGPTYIGVRDVSVTTDRYGQIVEDTPGTWVVYYGDEPLPTPGIARRTSRCTTTDRGMTFANHTPVLLPDQTYDSLGAMCGSVIKIASNLYYMWYTANGDLSDTAHTGGVGLAISTDNRNWTKQGIIIPSTTSAIVDYTCVSMAVPRVRVMRDGKWTMFCESRPYPGNFRVVGFTATSPDGPWTAMNSGHVVRGPDPAMWWATDGFANPYVDELDDGSGYLLFTNGAISSQTPPNFNWQTGFLTASTYNGPYTQDPGSPPFGRPLNWYGLETSVLAIDAATRERVVFIQDYGVSAGQDSYPSIFRVWPVTDRGGLVVTTAGPEAAVAGVPTGAGPFTVETVSWMTTHRSEDSNLYILSLMDTPSLPAPDTSANILASGILRLSIRRTTFANASAGDIAFLYYDPGGVSHVWDGSAWSPSGVAANSDTNRPVIARIDDDGTRYVFTARYDDDGTLLAQANVLKSAVKPFVNTPMAVLGDIFTSSQTGGLFFRQVGVRTYAAIEPAITVGAEVPLATPPTTTTGIRLLEGGASRLLEGGAFRLVEGGSVVVSPAAGRRLLEGGAFRLLEGGAFRLLESDGGGVVPPAQAGVGVATYVQRGCTIDYVPSADLAGGDVVDFGTFVGITRRRIAAGDMGALTVDGIFSVDKPDGEAVAFGVPIYWDDVLKVATGVPGGSRTKMGLCVRAALADDYKVRVKLLMG